MKYIINLLKQTFRMTLNMHLRSTNQIHMDLKNHRHFRQRSDFSRNTIQFNTFRFIYQNTLIYIFKTLRLPMKLLNHINSQTSSGPQTSRGTQFN